MPLLLVLVLVLLLLLSRPVDVTRQDGGAHARVIRRRRRRGRAADGSPRPEEAVSHHPAGPDLVRRHRQASIVTSCCFRSLGCFWLFGCALRRLLYSRRENQRRTACAVLALFSFPVCVTQRYPPLFHQEPQIINIWLISSIYN